ncbi:hypothetical protein NMG60_11002099 [Bertholletia excelsa]
MTEVAEVAANGTMIPEKKGEDAPQNKDEEKDGVNKMEEDGKDDEIETQRMDVDPEGKENNAIKEEEKGSEEEVKENEEETRSKAMEEETEKKETEDSKEKVEEMLDGESKQVTPSKRGGKGKNAGVKVNSSRKKVEEKKEPKTPMVSTNGRPIRERKSVERLVAIIEKDSVKEFYIGKGPGTALKDIPNVAYKLSKRRSDDTFKLLHTILFGRRGKAADIKSNISRFSGFVWKENEEKQKIKVKEKLDKCVKEKLLEFCDLLDMPINKTTIKKEDIVVKLIDFLVAPHATTTESLAEKDQSSRGKKRKRVVEGSASKSESTSSKRSAKSHRQSGNESKGKEKYNSSETDDKDEEDDEEEECEGEETANGVPGRSKTDVPEHSESEEDKSESKAESEEDTGKEKRGSKKPSAKRESVGKVKSKKVVTPKKSTPPNKKAPMKSPSNRSKVDINSGTSPKTFSRKKKTGVVKEKSSTPKKPALTEKTAKRVTKEKDKPKEVKLKPSDDELRNAICEILKQVDFNTATFTDILKQLGGRFRMDLTPRKSSIKLMIQDELTKLADEADDEEDEGDTGKDETKSPSQGVEA